MKKEREKCSHLSVSNICGFETTDATVNCRLHSGIENGILSSSLVNRIVHWKSTGISRYISVGT